MSPSCDHYSRVGLNIPQIEVLAIWVGGMHCVIVTKLWGAQIFGVVGLNSLSLYGKDAEISASVRIYVRDRTFTCRLCLRTPDPSTVGKLRRSAFLMWY